MKPSVLSIAAFTLLLNLVGCADSSDSALKTTIGGNPGEAATLGMGYNLLSGRLTGSRCFEGGTIFKEPGSSELLNEKNVSYERVRNLLEGSLAITVPVYPGITATGRASYGSDFHTTKYADTYTIALTATTDTRRLYLGDFESENINLTNVPQRIRSYYGTDTASMAADYQHACGQEYVASVSSGMSLLVSLRAEYANEYDKRAFSGGLEANLLEGVVSGSLDVGYEQIQSTAKANISLHITQKGGDPKKILSIFRELGEGERTTPGSFFLQCDSKNQSQCIDVYKAILTYAKNIHQSIKTGEGTDLGNTIPLVMETEPYPTAGALKEISALGPKPYDYQTVKEIADGLKKARSSIDKAKSLVSADIKRTARLREQLGLAISDELNKDLDAITSNAEAASAVIQEAETTCAQTDTLKTVADLQPCQAKSQAALAATNYTTDALTVDPQRFYSWCIMAHTQGVLNTADLATSNALIQAVGLQMVPLTDDPELPLRISSFCEQAEESVMAATEINISRLHPTDPIVTSLNPLGSLKNLHTIEARNQLLSDASGLSQLPSLETVDLYGNFFTTLDSFANWPQQSLQTLNLGRNHVTSIFSSPEKSGAINWMSLDLSENILTDIPAIPSVKLQILDLSDNPLSSIRDLVANNLEVLIIQGSSHLECPYEDQQTCQY